MQSAKPRSQPQHDPGGRFTNGKHKRRPPEKVTCRICHKKFSRITASHLKTHGFTLTRYRRVYRSPTRAGCGSSAHPGDPTEADGVQESDRQTVTTLARRIVEDPQVIRDLAGEVSEAIFSTSLREQLRMSLVSTISQRLKAHGHAVDALNRIREEATQQWRIEQGGENGGPTPTKDLVALTATLGQEVKQGEELLLKTIKLAVDEFKGHKGRANVEGGLPDRYSGDGERLPVPPELTAQDRETIRTLWGMFDRAIEARQDIIDVPSTSVRPSADPVPDDPRPPMEGHPSSGPSQSPAEGIETPTPLREEDEPF